MHSPPPLTDFSSSSALVSAADGDDPMGLDLLLKIERENALRAQQAGQGGASALGQGASHLAVVAGQSWSGPSSFNNATNGTARLPNAGRPGQDDQTQLLAQILNNNSAL